MTPLPFALSLSKGPLRRRVARGWRGFDKLSPNGVRE